MEMKEQALALLRAARDLIRDPADWSPLGPGTALRHDENGCRCLLVAISHAWARLTFPVAAYQLARQVVASLIPRNAFDPLAIVIGHWNDTPGRTHAEVMVLLDEAEKALA